MSARITPLRLEYFEQLPKHARRCVFWEVDPREFRGGDHLADPEFEKEAWLSMVTLEWGSCGQIAIPAPAGHEDADAITEAPCIGYALYAPPGAVPRAGCFPTKPVSPDAVLLTTMGVEPGHAENLPRNLIAQAVADLVRRGARALEAFGRTREAERELIGIRTPPPDVRAVVEPFGDCSFDQCMIDADFLIGVGFTVIAAHRYFPRLRLELTQGLGWKAEVEAALERLLQSARLEPVGAGSCSGGGVRD
ncbi:acetyltransferase [Mycobacterium sp.]|uniref:acetyltransferase n=1 Tax=Mycobacterium sp. TaxID=1785 RepID=UPI002C0865C6|nr:acetyltransferase [Mycobacterium sp.]HME47955.1 acetyltransferase [Mycobacterium sp.]